MTDLVDALASPRLFAAALVVFAFLPGLVLRLLVRLYPKGHLRRAELLGELYTRPYWERPFFVVQQFETTLFEGLPAKLGHIQGPRVGLPNRWQRMGAFWKGGTTGIALSGISMAAGVLFGTDAGWTIQKVGLALMMAGTVLALLVLLALAAYLQVLDLQERRRAGQPSVRAALGAAVRNEPNNG